MKSVGVIGGLGPETTAEFYLQTLFSCQKINSIRRPLIVTSSVPLPFEIENDLLSKNIGKERYIPFLLEEARRLQKTNVDFLVMPCNSLHVFIEEIRKSVTIPVLSIVEETTQYVAINKFQKVGLISTSATVENSVYEKAFAAANIDYITPDGLQRAKMDRIILRLIEGQHLNADRETILSIINSLKQQGVDAIALACTDLQLLIPQDDEVAVFDTMKVLSDATASCLLSD